MFILTSVFRNTLCRYSVTSGCRDILGKTDIVSGRDGTWGSVIKPVDTCTDRSLKVLNY